MASDKHQEPVEKDTHQLIYNHTFWNEKLGHPSNIHASRKPHLLFSLMVYLAYPMGQYLWWIFMSEIPLVKTRVTKFLTYEKNTPKDSPHQFWPSTLYRNWHTHKICAKHMHETIIDPCINHLVISESNKLSKNPEFKVTVSKITINGLRQLMNPKDLMLKYQDQAPRFWSILDAFTSSPSDY